MLNANDKQYLNIRTQELVRLSKGAGEALERADFRTLARKAAGLEVLSHLLRAWLMEKRVFEEEMPTPIERSVLELEDELRKAKLREKRGQDGPHKH